MKVLAMSGSLRTGSHNLRLLRAAARELPAEVEFQLYRGLGDIPAYREDRDGTDGVPVPVAALRAAIGGADAVLIATPEYNASIPGLLKNALDWASRPWPDNCLRNRPVAVIGASTGLFGAVWAQAELRKVLVAIGAAVLDVELPVGQADSAFTSDGELIDPGLRTALAALVGRLVDTARPDPVSAR